MKKLLYILLFVPFAAQATNYYVSNSGSDSANGTTTGTAWQTISKVNGFTFNAGDTVKFNGGQSFSGGLVHQGNIAYSSYGTGLATISSGTSIGFYSLNKSNVSVKNLIFIGTTGTVDGVHIENSQSGNTKLQNVNISGCTVSGYGANGIAVIGTSGTSGYNNVNILNCVTHDCTYGITPGSGTSGILIQSPSTGYGLGSTTPCFTNVLVDHCTSYNNTGKTGDSNWTGSGIFMGETSGGIIQYCTTYNNGLNSNGTVGIWFADGINMTIQYCESYLTKLASGTDGDGFDIDGGVKNGIIQYCYSHDNMGAGFQVYTYSDGQVTGSDNCIVRYCISQNDGTFGSNAAANVMIGNDGGTLTNVYIYNNSFYQSGTITNPKNITFEGSNASSITGYIANNICYSNTGSKFIYSTTTPIMTIVGNDYYNPGTQSFFWNNVNYSTFAAWQAASGQEKIAGSNVGKTANPVIMSPGNGGIINAINANLYQYRQSNTSTLLGQGLNLVSLYGLSVGSTDFYGNPIPNTSGNYDIGAQQYNVIKVLGRIVLL